MSDTICNARNLPSICLSNGISLKLYGICGYIFGALGFFIYMRLLSAIFPGVLSYIMLLAIIFISAFLEIAFIQLFMSLSGKRGGGAKLFYLFGCAYLLFTLALPIGLIHSFSPMLASWLMFLLAIGIFVLKIKLVRFVYTFIPLGSALISVILPGIALQFLFALSILFTILNSAWLFRVYIQGS